MTRGTMRRHFLAHRWTWLSIAVAAVLVNELVDRNFFDHREHVDGDVVVTLVVLVLAIAGSYAVSRLLARGPQTPR